MNTTHTFARLGQLGQMGQLGLTLGLLALSGCPNSVGITCPTGETLCGNVCVYVSVDEANCGACGTQCPPTLACINGKCDCPQGLTKCGNICVNTMEDNLNCGACSTACPAGNVCSQGACGLSCQASLTDCSGTCTNTQTDPKDCGGCGTVCPAGQMCSSGACALDCSAAEKICNKTCVNPQVDINNCGDCGIACKAGFVCSAGVCAPTCNTNLLLCTGLCVDTQNDPQNCGDCAVKCPPNQFCSAGKCTPPCPPGFLKCISDGGASDAGTVCVDPNNDPKNCGGCGGDGVTQPDPSAPPLVPHICTPTAGFGTVPACASGVCEFPCSPGFTDCDQVSQRGLSNFHRVSSPGAASSAGRRISSSSAAPPPAPAPIPGVLQFTCFNGDTGTGANAAEECCTPTVNDACDCGGCGIGCNGWCDNSQGFNNCFNNTRRLGSFGRPTPLNSCFLSDVESNFTQQCCGASCVDTISDNSCGDCTTQVDCTASEKGCCPDNGGTANGHCTDFSTLVDCGECNNNCGGQVPLCCESKGFSCHDGATDRFNCGACGNNCTVVVFPSPSPNDPECCPAGLGAGCFDFNNDVNHCGACDVVCTGTKPACCPFNGCHDLDSDVNNCGACGTVCPACVNCQTPVCTGGGCGCTGPICS